MAIVADLQRMGEWSPQCKVMKVIGGTVREGAKTINVNRKGLLVWPTSSKVVRFEPNKSVAFRIAENRTIWSYELEPTATGTKVTERAEAPAEDVRRSRSSSSRPSWAETPTSRSSWSKA